MSSIIFIFVIVSIISYFHSCETRFLVAVTCETRSGINGLNALKVWNITGELLRKQGLYMTNICEGVPWSRYHFLTKPLLYSNYIRTMINSSLTAVDNYSIPHVILMDSDTFWSASNIDIVWKKFDQVSNGKSIVVATEVQCWIGRYCDKTDVQKWYPDPNVTSSYSLFVNSGFIMGKASKVLEMLDYIISHNKSYFINSGSGNNKKSKFDDQFAVTDYALSIAPHDVALDYQQALSAGFSIHIAVGDSGWFICKANYENISYRCGDNKNLPLRSQVIYMNGTTCHVVRNEGLSPTALYYSVLRDLSTDPIIWHGNGAGKRPSYHYSQLTFDCHLKQRNISSAAEFFSSYKG